MKLIEINEQELNAVDLTDLCEHVVESEYKRYFLDKPGNEHYRLLAYFSTQFNNSTLLDIGTYKGCSALALAFNKTNIIKSFDVSVYKTITNPPTNIEFFIDDITDSKYVNIILESPFILLDTNHDGPFEYKFYEHLKNIEYKGILMLDDIKLNDVMSEYWSSITEEKYDISKHGHYSGTGIVIFK